MKKFGISAEKKKKLLICRGIGRLNYEEIFLDQKFPKLSGHGGLKNNNESGNRLSEIKSCHFLFNIKPCREPLEESSIVRSHRPKCFFLNSVYGYLR